MKKIFLSIIFAAVATASYGQTKNKFTVKKEDETTFVSGNTWKDPYDPFKSHDISKIWLITSQDYSQTKIDQTVLKKPGTVEILCPGTPSVQAKLNSVTVSCSDVVEELK